MAKDGKISNEALPQHLAFALLAAKRAGEAILGVYRDDIDVDYKDDNTPLTLADRQAHSIILNHLSTVPLREIPILSEEGEHAPYEKRKRWEYFWLVDPLDGTKEFIKRRGEFSVNIALIHKNSPVLGVVFIPSKGSLYFAAKGVGSYQIEQPEEIEWFASAPADVQNMSGPLAGLDDFAKRLPFPQAHERSENKLRIVGSRSHATKALTDFAAAVEQRYGEVELTPAGSALKFCLVAEGRADIYPRFTPTMEWDTAAGQCIVEQSGGAVLRFKDEAPLDYNKSDLHNPHFICLGREFRDFPFELTGVRNRNEKI